ncbi:ABC transporter ATP-binding protein [Frigidibacter sp. ROC022]|uniref:ABC transporter ATP-binding protein n=1 Tax=Frigidibacter sp. ROC022 TaxID=2971796 RepID=UPI00215B1211|nr:ABC transporter ATP-binding protein [Frigidibacter sp. ROC022]MCR8726846.1 ABC transporter ATP-binding protein [Frigidibacter sp. ROC022]
MIELRDLCKSFLLRGQRKVVADRLNVVFPSGVSVALLGRNGAGKSTLLRMIAGISEPDSGEVLSTGSISWPVGFAGSFHPLLTGLQNTRFIARVYGVDTDELVAFVREFSELGRQFFLPTRSYSSGMKSRLAFGISMGIEFDTYLVDEVTAAGDRSFRQKSDRLMEDRLTRSGAIVVSHGMGQVRRLCQHGAVLEAGRLTYYTDVEEAIAHHERLMQARSDMV